MKKRRNPLPYVPPGRYLSHDVRNRQHVTPAYAFKESEKLPAAVRLIRKIARGELPPSMARERAKYFIARIDSAR